MGTSDTSRMPDGIKDSVAYDGSHNGYADPWHGLPREDLSDLAWRGRTEIPALWAKTAATVLAMMSPSEIARRQAQPGGLSINLDARAHCEILGAHYSELSQDNAGHSEEEGVKLRPMNSHNQTHSWKASFSGLDPTSADWTADLYAEKMSNPFYPRWNKLQEGLPESVKNHPKSSMFKRRPPGYSDESTDAVPAA